MVAVRVLVLPEAAPPVPFGEHATAIAAADTDKDNNRVRREICGADMETPKTMGTIIYGVSGCVAGI